MELVKTAVEEMVEGLESVEYGITWSKPTANFTGELTRTWELSDSAVNFMEETLVSEKVYEVAYDDLVTLVVDLETETERELKAFSINSAVVTRGALDEENGRYPYTLRFSYYLAI